jgi:hypothetical protein
MNFKTLIFGSALLSAALFSCSKDNDDDSLPKSMGFTLHSIKLDETRTDTTLIDTKEMAIITRKAVMTNDIVTITGTTLGLDVVNISVRATKEGKYEFTIKDLNDPKFQCLGTIETSYTNSEGEVKNAFFTSNRGTVVLTKVDTAKKIVSGTFEFDLFSGDVYKTIRKGKFENLKYSKY